MHTLVPSIAPGCPVRTTLEMLGGKWRLLLLHQLVGEGCRFGEIRQLVPDISEKVLVHELKRLVRAELVQRTPQGGASTKVTYHLTPMGHQALLVLAAVAEFGFKYADYVRAGRLARGPSVRG